jgi:formyltetrahydrofolate deformylase
MSLSETASPKTLLVECPDRPGLVHHITGVLFRHGCNVTSNHEFVDGAAGRFFMRTEFTGEVASASVLADINSFLPPAGAARLATPGPRRLVVVGWRGDQ